MRPISLTGNACGLRRRAETVGFGGRHGADDLEIVAAGERGLEHRRVGRDGGLRGVRERHARNVDLGGDLRHAAELGEIAGQPVRHVHRGGGMRAHGFGQGIARLRQQIARHEMVALRVAERPGRAFTQHQPERGIADAAGDEDEIARARTGAAHHGARRHAADHGDGNHDRPGRAVGVAAEQRAAEGFGIGAQALRERREPGLADVLRQRERDEEAERRRALGREIRQVHAQRLLRHRVGGILGEKVDAADDGVGLEHDVAARRRGEESRVVGERQRARMGRDRLEEARDQAVFGGEFVGVRCHGVAYSRKATPSPHPGLPTWHECATGTGLRGEANVPHAANSSARSLRASWSSTALTMPVSSRSTKAEATSAYSVITTRAGTSRRCEIS